MLKTEAYVRSLEKAGLAHVSSYRHSGNISFDSEISSDEVVKEIISEQLELLMGSRIDVFLFRSEKIGSLIGDDPFKGHLSEGDRAFATFMSKSPSDVPKMPCPLQEGISLIDVIEEIALSSVLKNVGSGPVNDLLQTRFGVSATTRNWSTVKGLMQRQHGR